MKSVFVELVTFEISKRVFLALLASLVIFCCLSLFAIKRRQFNMNTEQKRKQNKKRIVFDAVLKTALLALIAFCAKRTVQSGDSIIYMIPNFLLFTPFPEITKYVWSVLDPLSRLTDVREHAHINEIECEKFNMQAMEECTEGWSEPCIVRGLFIGTRAVNEWDKKGYLSSLLHDYNVSYAENARNEDAFQRSSTGQLPEVFHSIIDDNNPGKYIFTRAKKDHLSKVVYDDLQFNDRVGEGFGLYSKDYLLTLFIVGRGSGSVKETTGTGWHSEGAHNWFIQVFGAKRWYFMHPRYSSYFSPQRSSKLPAVIYPVSSKLVSKYFDYLPLSYVDVRAGDLLYNPAWYWHKIQNRKGLSIASPIRELNLRVFQNNAQYSFIAIFSKLCRELGLSWML